MESDFIWLVFDFICLRLNCRTEITLFAGLFGLICLIDPLIGPEKETFLRIRAERSPSGPEKLILVALSGSRVALSLALRASRCAHP